LWVLFIQISMIHLTFFFFPFTPRISFLISRSLERVAN
jgi:hypothetical protein